MGTAAVGPLFLLGDEGNGIGAFCAVRTMWSGSDPGIIIKRILNTERNFGVFTENSLELGSGF